MLVPKLFRQLESALRELFFYTYLVIWSILYKQIHKSKWREVKCKRESYNVMMTNSVFCRIMCRDKSFIVRLGMCIKRVNGVHCEFKVFTWLPLLVGLIVKSVEICETLFHCDDLQVGWFMYSILIKCAYQIILQTVPCGHESSFRWCISSKLENGSGWFWSFNFFSQGIYPARTWYHISVVYHFDGVKLWIYQTNELMTRCLHFTRNRQLSKFDLLRLVSFCLMDDPLNKIFF